MPDRSDQRRDQRRDTILAAAEALFAEEGEAGLSMRRLAERAAYSPAALYTYFRNKDELCEALKESFFEYLLSQIEENMPQGPLTAACLKECLKLYIRAGLAKPFHYKMGFRQMRTRDETYAVYDQGSHAAKASGFLKALIEEGMEAGVLRREDPMLVTHSVWAAMHGITMLMVQLPDYPADWHDSPHIHRDQLIDFHVSNILRGIAAPQKEN